MLSIFSHTGNLLSSINSAPMAVSVRHGSVQFFCMCSHIFAHACFFQLVFPTFWKEPCTKETDTSSDGVPSSASSTMMEYLLQRTNSTSSSSHGGSQQQQQRSSSINMDQQQQHRQRSSSINTGRGAGAARELHRRQGRNRGETRCSSTG